MRANFLLGQETENANTEAKYGRFPLTKLSRKFAARVPEWGYRTGLLMKGLPCFAGIHYLLRKFRSKKLIQHNLARGLVLMKLIFRAAEYSDITTICAGLHCSFVPLLKRLYPGGYYAYFTQPSWVREKIDKEFVYVCVLDDMIVGGLIILKNPDKKNLKLHTVYVDGPYRRAGFATFMINKAEEIHGPDVLWKLETLEELSGNIALYEKLGYKPDSPPKITENGLEIVYYSKRV